MAVYVPCNLLLDNAILHFFYVCDCELKNININFGSYRHLKSMTSK